MIAPVISCRTPGQGVYSGGGATPSLSSEPLLVVVLPLFSVDERDDFPLFQLSVREPNRTEQHRNCSKPRTSIHTSIYAIMYWSAFIA